MDLIRTGIGLTKTIKNVQRFREILTVFARHGFDEFIIGTKLNAVIPNFVIPQSRFKKEEGLDDYTFWKSVGYRLRKSFEELGPSFIKVGQLLASREDILDPALISQLKLLQNKALTIDFEAAKLVLRHSLEKDIDEVFESLDPNPIGVASIGVVYKAILKETGEPVVVKIQRPGIRSVIQTDFEIIAFIVARLEKFSSEIKYLGLSRAIDDFFKSIQYELNFLIEANNNQKLKKIIENYDSKKTFVIPKVYRHLSTDKVLVMEFLDGTPFNDIQDIREHPELQKNLEEGVKVFMHTMLSDGFFHADLHGGNFFQLADNKIGLIDFGLVGTLSKKNRANLVAILYALLTNNYENLVYEFLDVADYEVIPNHDLLVHDIRDALQPYIGMSVQEMDATALTYAIVSTLSKHQIYLPRDWFVIFRSLMTLDGAGKTLNVDLNIFEIIEDEIKDVLEELVSKDTLMEEAAWLGRDLLSSFRIIPRHLRWLLKEFAKKKYQLELNLIGTNQEINFLARSFQFVGLMILCSVFCLCGVLILGDTVVKRPQDLPILCYVFWGLALGVFFKASLTQRAK